MPHLKVICRIGKDPGRAKETSCRNWSKRAFAMMRSYRYLSFNIANIVFFCEQTIGHVKKVAEMN
ncbi:hypothetical protein DW785_04020 [Bacteroides xylanisolvens]|uniref:Uncharacterized protein n=1 Tax=Bacteroides thetaiotaomicron TaxID=818 RepID=A0A414HG74_BACT4|nr:hypothetical protein DW785_04020 [Bacteroides xylanisolvens]RHD84002.1 hypothetical protein DW780_20145 [Bacteroides thetaiotaomicron]